MQHALPEVRGEALVVSQFTLYSDVQKGRRPDFTAAALPEEAKGLYERFMERLQGHGVPAQAGVFGAKMLIQLENDGPVTLILESPRPRHEVSGRKEERS
jgi:D-tyrosyl-tRNA(Tyr) deacylase